MELVISRAEESWRVSRLEKAYRTFLDVYGISKEQADLLLESVEDSKGQLIVKWIGGLQPTPEQKRAFSIAWGVCGEHGENVHHNNWGCR